MYKVFWPPIFREGWPQLFYGRLLARFIVPHLAKFGWVPFADLCMQSLAMKWNAEFTEGEYKTSILFHAVCGPKCMKFLDDVEDPSHFLTSLPGCLCHILFRRYSPLSLEVVEKPNRCIKFFWPQSFGELWPRLLYGELLARFTVLHLAKLVEFHLLISIYKAWQWSRMLNLWTVGKNSNPVFSRLWIKIHAILRWCRRPVLVAKALTRLSIYCVVRKKLALSCEVVEKKGGFWAPNL